MRPIEPPGRDGKRDTESVGHKPDRSERFDVAYENGRPA